MPLPDSAYRYSRALALALIAVGAAPAFAQQDARPRNFAPGVLRTIPPEVLPEETVSVHPLVELRANEDLAWEPEYLSSTQTLYQRAAHARFTRDIWCLEFSFKPLRLIWIDLPQPNGKIERKLVWYLVYAVRNTGEALSAVDGEDGLGEAKRIESGPVQFVPHFVLRGNDQIAGRTLYRAYLDRVIPTAVEAIRRRETPGRRLLTSVQMASTPVPVSTESNPNQVWGVAMWEDVDPDLDFFSIYVRGLTNAYRWEDPEDGYQQGDPLGTGRQFVSKTLQLNFWRPGDRFLQHESEIRFGVAPGKADLYGEGVSEGVAHRWVYR